MADADPAGEVVEVGDSTQGRTAVRQPSEEPLLDRGTKFWLWMLGLAVLVAVAAVVVGLVIG